MGDSLLLVRPHGASSDSGHLLTYKQLAGGYKLVDTELRLSGTCLNAPVGTILLGTAGPLLTESSARSIPAVALARALSPGSEFQVPATKETRLLVGALPIPNGTWPPVRQAQRQPNATGVRLREE